MKRVSHSSANCPIARSLDIFGEWWSLLILRECFSGVTRFDDFQANLGVSKNTLTARLNKMVERGVLKRVPVAPGAKREHYKLTAMGKELHIVFIALRQWGDKWTFDGEPPPNAVIEKATGLPVAEVEVRSRDGRTLKPRDTVLVRVG
jgi:DNA-binding HxlR family transcriptional regulator